MDKFGRLKAISGLLPDTKGRRPDRVKLMDEVSGLATEIAAPAPERLVEGESDNILLALKSTLQRLKAALEKSKSNEKDSKDLAKECRSLNRDNDTLRGSVNNWQWASVGTLVFGFVAGLLVDNCAGAVSDLDVSTASEPPKPAQVVKDICEHGVQGTFKVRKGSKESNAKIFEVVEPASKKGGGSLLGGFTNAGDFGCDAKAGVLPTNFAGVYESKSTAVHKSDDSYLTFKAAEGSGRDAFAVNTGRTTIPEDLKLNPSIPFVWLALEPETNIRGPFDSSTDRGVQVIYEVVGKEGTVSTGFLNTLRNLRQKDYSRYLYVVTQTSWDGTGEIMPLDTFLEKVK